MIRTLLTALVATALAAVILVGVLWLGAEETPLETFEVSRGRFEVALQTEGDLEAAKDVPIPFSPPLEDFVLPSVSDVVDAARAVAYR